jgi:glutamine cyclotransferase
MMIFSKDLTNLNTVQMPNQMVEGWGLTHDSESLIASDGTNNIFYIDPEDYQVTKTIPVVNDGSPLQYINELELVDNFLYANVFPQSIIVKIDITTGEVVKRYDFSDLYNYAYENRPSS